MVEVITLQKIVLVCTSSKIRILNLTLYWNLLVGLVFFLVICRLLTKCFWQRPNFFFGHNIRSLEYCRLEFDLVLTYQYKICNKLSDILVLFDEFFVWSECSYNLRRHTKTLTFKDKPKHKEYSHCFVIVLSLCAAWNSLPQTVVSATSLYVFKKKLKQFDWHNAANLMF